MRCFVGSARCSTRTRRRCRSIDRSVLSARRPRRRGPTRGGVRGRDGCAAATRNRIVDAPPPGTGRREVEEDEAEQHGGFALVLRGPESLWKVRHEIGDGHLAGEQERDGTREEAEDD